MNENYIYHYTIATCERKVAVKVEKLPIIKETEKCYFVRGNRRILKTELDINMSEKRSADIHYNIGYFHDEMFSLSADKAEELKKLCIDRITVALNRLEDKVVSAKENIAHVADAPLVRAYKE